MADDRQGPSGAGADRGRGPLRRRRPVIGRGGAGIVGLSRHPAVAFALGLALGQPRRPPARRRGDPQTVADDAGVSIARHGALFLADGGLWNNLGSHVLREHRILQGREGVDAGFPCCASTPRPRAQPARHRYSIPLVAQFAALFRTLRVLTVNTVQPRVKAIADAMTRRNALGTRPSPHDPLDVVVDLSGVSRHEETSGRSAGPAEVRRSDPVHDQSSPLVAKLCAWAEHVEARRRRRTATAFPGWSSARARPARGSDEGVGVLDRRTLEEILVQPVVGSDPRQRRPRDLAVPTTLDRVRRSSAAELVLRGYANTWLSSLLLDPYDANVAPHDIVARVHQMAGLPAAGQRRDTREPTGDRQWP